MLSRLHDNFLAFLPLTRYFHFITSIYLHSNARDNFSGADDDRDAEEAVHRTRG